MKAAPHQQQRLLDLQAIDTRLDQIQHARTHLPQLAELADLEEKAQVLGAEQVRVQTAHDDVQRELRKSDADVQQVRDRAARDEHRLNSGRAAPRTSRPCSTSWSRWLDGRPSSRMSSSRSWSGPRRSSPIWPS